MGASGGTGRALGELWEALYRQKLPINRPCGRYVIILLSRWPSLKRPVCFASSASNSTAVPLAELQDSRLFRDFSEI